MSLGKKKGGTKTTLIILEKKNNSSIIKMMPFYHCNINLVVFGFWKDENKICMFGGGKISFKMVGLALFD